MNIMQFFAVLPRINSEIIRRLLCIAVIPIVGTSAFAQPDPQALLVGAGIGTGIYHGEFNSLQDGFSLNPGYTVSALLQYNLNSSIAVGAGLGYTSLPYSISSFNREKYASNFFGPLGGTTYPGSPVEITDANSISLSQLQLFGKLNLSTLFAGLLPEKLTPYAMAGLGLITFTPTNDNGEDLPTNVTGTYSTTSLIIPLGGGVEYKLTDKFTAWGEIVYQRSFTDYLDGYAHYLDYGNGTITSGPGTQPTQNDHFTTLRVGLSYKVYQYKPSPEPEQSSPLASNDSPVEQPTPDPPPQERPRQTAPTPPEPTPAEPTEPTPAAKQPTPPTQNRTNDAYKRDPEAADSDGDQLSDQDEISQYGTDPFSKDSDNDGLTDGEEAVLYNTNPLAADTDGDLLSDLSEVRKHGTNPREVDTDSDLLSDNEELARTSTDPLNPDTDGDGVIDGLDDCPTTPGLAENNGCSGDQISADLSPSLNPEIDQQPDAAPGEPLDKSSLSPLEPGERREFANIFFRHNSDDFDFSRPETGENLKQLLDFMQECDEVGALIEGHTSGEGDPNRNMELSKLRAERVNNWLIANGVSPTKLLGTVGYGSRMPKISEPQEGVLSDASLERIRAQNRRITALIRKSCE